MKKQMNLKEKGITLVALVVTIVVMLILAGVTLYFSFGQNSIITKAEEASKLAERTSSLEQLNLVNTEWDIEKNLNKSSNLGTFLAEKKQEGAIDDYTDLGDGIYILKKSNYKITLDNGSVTTWDGTTVSESLQGEGTEDNPFLIRNGSDFKFLQNAIVNKDTKYTFAYIKQVKDIQLNDTSNYANWSTDASGLHDNFAKGTFYGQYDGGNHTISGLYINTEEYAAGLFQYLYSAMDSGHNKMTNCVVKNLKLTNAYVKGTESVGIVTGYMGQEATIQNCEVRGTVIGDGQVGGVAGSVYQASTIRDTHNYASVESSNYSGGIAGQSHGNITLANCTNNGLIKGKQNVGGITGEAITANIENCVNTGRLESIGDNYYYYFGGISGRMSGNMKNCINYGNIIINDVGGKDSSQIGGLIGVADVGEDPENPILCHLENSTNTGNIDTSASNVGGVIGQAASNDSDKQYLTIKNCSNTGKLIATQQTLNNVGAGYYTSQD